MEYKYETVTFPVIKAKWFTDVSEKRKVRVIVIHTMEAAKRTIEQKNRTSFEYLDD